MFPMLLGAGRVAAAANVDNHRDGAPKLTVGRRVSRREQIKMTAAEAEAFLSEERTMTCATGGPRGWPHLMPLWYVPRAPPADVAGPRLWAWTYAASQKVRNLERAPRATLQVETGEDYAQLRGVMMECEVVIHREEVVVRALGEEIFARYAVPRGQSPAKELPGEVAAMVEKQAAKRVGLEFVERRRTSWDHRKLGGLY
jgi:nitroimidazol reductase NimA-like FMN-containing flavoprotein (pyridoxamine 5'-phosphate oxidase superfamily)